MSGGTKHFYEFGPFRVDATERQLLRGGEVVPLSPKLFDILMVLVENGGHILEKEELMKIVWPDSVVEEGSLTRNVSTLRKALGKNPNEEQYIETIPWRGYRFTASVSEISDEGGELIVQEHSRSRVVIEEKEEADPIDRIIEFDLGSPDRGRGWSAASKRDGKWGGALRPRLAVVVVAVLIIPLLVYALFFRAAPASPPPEIKSLAVLPLKSLSGDAKDDFLGLGVADTIVMKVSQIRGLTVRPTSAVHKYATGDIDSLEAARQLHVDAVLDGTVQRAGGRLRVNMNLLRTHDGVSLWTESFDIRFDDLFKMQDDVAKEVTLRLQLKLNPAEQAHLNKQYTQNLEAYQLYLQGRYHFEKWTVEGTKVAREHFAKAIEKDPNYALAYAGLADSYVFGSRDDPNSKEALQKARAAAMKALEIDSTLGEAHAALAQVRFMDDWDWAGAEEEFKRAIELSPGYAEAHHMYSHLLLESGRIAESLTESKAFFELDPQSPAANLHLGYHYLAARQYDQAIDWLRKTLAMDPNYRDGHRHLSLAYYQKGMFAEAVEEFVKVRLLSGGSTEEVTALRQAYAAFGIRGYWRKRIDQLEKEARHKLPAYSRVAPYAQVGDKDKAFEWLERAYQEHSSDLLHLKEDLLFDPLRSDQRFSSLVRRIGLIP